MPTSISQSSQRRQVRLIIKSITAVSQHYTIIIITVSRHLFSVEIPTSEKDLYGSNLAVKSSERRWWIKSTAE